MNWFPSRVGERLTSQFDTDCAKLKREREQAYQEIKNHCVKNSSQMWCVQITFGFIFFVLHNSLSNELENRKLESPREREKLLAQEYYKAIFLSLDEIVINCDVWCVLNRK